MAAAQLLNASRLQNTQLTNNRKVWRPLLQVAARKLRVGRSLFQVATGKPRVGRSLLQVAAGKLRVARPLF